MAVSAAFAAALIGLAPAARADTDLDPFQDLFGINAWTPSADSFLASDPTNAASFDTSVDAFQSGAGADDPFSILVAGIDPGAFSVDPNSGAYFADGGAPTDALGTLATGLDYTLFATGLGPTLDQTILTLGELPVLLLLPLAGFLA
jgi:hypothetical protein